MGDEIGLPPSKKRAAGRELSRDNPGLDDDEDVSEMETGTFKKASDDVLASRRIVKVRRSQTSSTPPAPSNPFAGIRLVPVAPAEAVNEAKQSVEEDVGEEVDKPDKANKDSNGDGKETLEKCEGAVRVAETSPAAGEEAGDNDKKEAELKPTDEKEAEVPTDEKEAASDVKEADADKPADIQGQGAEDIADNKEKNDENSPGVSAFGSFQQLSSTKNAFTGLAGSGFSNTTFSFGSAATDGSPSGSGFLFGSKADQPSVPSFLGFSSSNNGNAPLFGSAAGSSTGGKSDIPSMQEVSVETGEENEESVFNADAALYEFSEGGWKERGKGEVKVNVLKEGTKKARLVMRARGNYRLILNAALYPDMKLTAMEKKGITFACLNSASEGIKGGLETWALKFKDGSFVESFSTAVAAHKGRSGDAADDKTNSPGKTPDNSPKAADVV